MSGQPLLELHAVTRVERLEALARARLAVARPGGWIPGHQQFSNVSLCLWFEVDGGRLPEPGEALRETGIQLTSEPEAAAGDVRGSLQIACPRSEPDLRMSPPETPG